MRVHLKRRIEEQKQHKKAYVDSEQFSIECVPCAIVMIHSGMFFFTLNLIFITVTITLAVICQRERHYSFVRFQSNGDVVRERDRIKWRRQQNMKQPFVSEKVDVDDNSVLR